MIFTGAPIFCNQTHTRLRDRLALLVMDEGLLQQTDFLVMSLQAGLDDLLDHVVGLPCWRAVAQYVLLALHNFRIRGPPDRAPAGWRRRHASQALTAELRELVRLARGLSATSTPILPAPSMTAPWIWLDTTPLPTSSEAARQRHVLADRRNRIRDRGLDGNAPTFAALIFDIGADIERDLRDHLDRNLELLVAGNEIGLELTSTTTPLPPDVTAPIEPSRDAASLLGSFDETLLAPANQSPPALSPLFSVSACLQSIMPAPVDSRRSLTIAAVIVAIVECPSCL